VDFFSDFIHLWLILVFITRRGYLFFSSPKGWRDTISPYFSRISPPYAKSLSIFFPPSSLPFCFNLRHPLCSHCHSVCALSDSAFNRNYRFELFSLPPFRTVPCFPRIQKITSPTPSGNIDVDSRFVFCIPTTLSAAPVNRMSSQSPSSNSPAPAFFVPTPVQFLGSFEPSVRACAFVIGIRQKYGDQNVRHQLTRFFLS